VSLLSDALDHQFTLIGSLTGGETGATAVQGVDGHRYVLKWELDPENQHRRREGVELAERLRAEALWPCPEQQLVEVDECLLVLQAFMAGENVNRLSQELVDTLFEMHERRQSLATDDDQNHWASDMIEILTEGGNGYCLHQPLRDFDSRTRRVVERIEEIGRSLKPSDISGNAVVHGDLHPGNLLQVDGRLSAVIDMDYTRVGDAEFDLAMLALTSLGVHVDPGVRSRLFKGGIENLPGAKRNAYVGNLLLRFLDWPIRKNRPAEIEFWLIEADRLLPPT
jgi:thiamine kinase-like enzyme